jgi:hypothetical protein
LTEGAAAVAIYQASQSVYDQFDKAAVLYEGRQIFFGPADQAKAYFDRQGWYCPPRQTTGDFLTAVTNPSERKAKKGMDEKVPRTPEDFEKYWRDSREYRNLQQEIKEFEDENPINEHSTLEELRSKKNLQQAKHSRKKSPYLVSVPMQVKLNTRRAYQRILGDVASTATQAILNIVMALIVGSIYFSHSPGTASFSGRGAVLFLAVLFNALTSIGEISGLYSQRPIVEKHNSYAFYHPATEAIAGIVADIPVKFLQAVVFNVILYFLARLRYTAGQFFLFFLVTVCIPSKSVIFPMCCGLNSQCCLPEIHATCLDWFADCVVILVHRDVRDECNLPNHGGRYENCIASHDRRRYTGSRFGHLHRLRHPHSSDACLLWLDQMVSLPKSLCDARLTFRLGSILCSTLSRS